MVGVTSVVKNIKKTRFRVMGMARGSGVVVVLLHGVVVDLRSKSWCLVGPSSLGGREASFGSRFR